MGADQIEDLEVGKPYGAARELGQRVILTVEGDRVCYRVPGLMTMAPLYATRAEFHEWLDLVTTTNA